MQFEDIFFDVPPTSLRDEQKKQTHERILKAAISLFSKGGEKAVTMRAVARRVGVTERTVYRHFDTRDTLLQNISEYLRLRVRPRVLPRTAKDLANRPRRLFPRYHDERALTHAYVRDLDTSVLPWETREGLKDAMFECAKDGLPYLDDATVRRRAAIAQIISSVQAWDLMVQYWGFEGELAGDASAEAIEILLNRRPAY